MYGNIKLVTDTIFAGGATGDGVTDDQAAFEAAATHIESTYDTVFVPPGRYLLGEGNIRVANGAFVGLPSPIDGNASGVPEASPGPVILTPSTQTDNPVFVMARGSRLQGLRFYWPDQTGEDMYWDGSPPEDPPTYEDMPVDPGVLIGSPTVYAPAIVTDTSINGGTFGVILQDLMLMNAYDGIRLGDATHECGAIDMAQIVACCLNIAYDVWNASGIITARGLQDTHSIWKGGRVNKSAPLGWMARNATAIRFNATLDDPATQEDEFQEAGAGMYLDEFWFRGIRRCIHVESGKTGFVHFVNGGVERSPTFLQVDPDAGLLHVVFSNITGHFWDASDPDYAPSVVILNSDGTAVDDGIVYFDNFLVQEAQGRVLHVPSTDNHSRLVWSGGDVWNFGQHANEYAFDIDSANLDFSCLDVQIFGKNNAGVRGIRATAAQSVTIVDCDFRNLDTTVNLGAGMYLDSRTCLGNVTTDSNGGTRRPLPIAPQLATIDANGAITVGSGYVYVAAAGASTDLKTVNGVSLGTEVTLLLADPANNVVVKDAAAGGNLHLAGDCTLDGQYDTIALTARNATHLLETGRSINGN